MSDYKKAWLKAAMRFLATGPLAVLCIKAGIAVTYGLDMRDWLGTLLCWLLTGVLVAMAPYAFYRSYRELAAADPGHRLRSALALAVFGLLLVSGSVSAAVGLARVLGI